jgi:hypothetical protein
MTARWPQTLRAPVLITALAFVLSGVGPFGGFGRVAPVAVLCGGFLPFIMIVRSNWANGFTHRMFTRR